MDQVELLMQVLTQLKKLEERIEALEKKAQEELSERESREAMFASLKKVEELSSRIKDVREHVEPLLEQAADAAIEHFRVQPPKRK